MNAEEASAVVVDAAFQLHRDLGPGLLESVYEAVLARMLAERGLAIERQKSLPFSFHGMHFDEGLRLDLLVEGCLVIELKSVESFAPVHAKQLLTYLRLSQLSLGLLINFGAATFKEGVRRIVYHHQDFAASREPHARQAAMGEMNVWLGREGVGSGSGRRATAEGARGLGSLAPLAMILGTPFAAVIDPAPQHLP